MNATMINSFLLNKWTGYSFGVGLASIINETWTWVYEDAYMFLKRELSVTNKEQYLKAKTQNLIRHCKPYRGKWLDYVVHKEFDTLEDWVKDCGATMGDILYGVNRVHLSTRQPYTPKYICLGHLLEHLDYKAPPVVDTQLQTVEDILTSHGLSLSNLWVIANGCPIQWKTFVDG